jgi:hypothetical protein
MTRNVESWHRLYTVRALNTITKKTHTDAYILARTHSLTHKREASLFVLWFWWFTGAVTWGWGQSLLFIQSWKTKPLQAIRLHLLLLESQGALSLMYGRAEWSSHTHTHTLWRTWPLATCAHTHHLITYLFIFQRILLWQNMPMHVGTQLHISSHYLQINSYSGGGLVQESSHKVPYLCPDSDLDIDDNSFCLTGEVTDLAPPPPTFVIGQLTFIPLLHNC